MLGPKVKVVSGVKMEEGHCWYEYPSVFSEAPFMIDSASLRCVIGRMVLTCDAQGQIRLAGGYLPHQTWRKVESLYVPRESTEQQFIVDETFDIGGRECALDATYVALCAPSMKAVAIVWDEDVRGTIAASPHPDLILTASEKGGQCRLNCITFMNVRNFPLR